MSGIIEGFLLNYLRLWVTHAVWILSDEVKRLSVIWRRENLLSVILTSCINRRSSCSNPALYFLKLIAILIRRVCNGHFFLRYCDSDSAISKIAIIQGKTIHTLNRRFHIAWWDKRIFNFTGIENGLLCSAKMIIEIKVIIPLIISRILQDGGACQVCWRAIERTVSLWWCVLLKLQVETF